MPTWKPLARMTATFIILITATVLLLSERLRPDLVALLVLVSLGATNVLTQQEVFSGFSRSAVITILAVFILAEGLLRAGIADVIGNLLMRVAGQSERRLTAAVMLCGAFLSLFMNNIAAASVLLPAVAGSARRTGVSPSRLLMPLAFATILGGMATLLTTTNIVASSVLRDQGLAGYGILSFAPLGFPMCAAGVLYMVFWGRHLLPKYAADERKQTREQAEASAADLVGLYRLGERLFRARVPIGSLLHDTRLADSRLREQYGLTVVAIERAPDQTIASSPDVVLKEHDVLVLKGDLADFRRRDSEPYLEILPAVDWSESSVASPDDTVVEVMLSPRSELIGQTIRSVHFRARYGMNVLALWRKGGQERMNVREIPLQFGDALLLQGPRSQLPVLRTERNFILLMEHDEENRPRVPRSRAVLALVIFSATFVLAGLHSDVVGEIMLGGALAMLLCNVLSMDDAYDAIDWKSIFLVAGMLPLGIAMSKTGAAQLLARHVVHAVGGFGPIGLLIALTLLSMMLTQAMSGAAVTAVVAPIAVQAARAAGLDPRAVVMGVALATSMAFLTPLGHPVNVLVMGQGGYRFRDYRHVGGGLTIILLLVMWILLPVLWPLH